MTSVNDRTEVEATHLRIAEIVQELYGRPDTDSDTVIAELAEHAAAEIPGARICGAAVTRNAKHIDTPAATHKWPVLLDEIQQRHRQGPCLTAAWEDERTIASPTWPPISGFRCMPEMCWLKTPIRSVMSFSPMWIAGETMGALNVYAETPKVFGPKPKPSGWSLRLIRRWRGTQRAATSSSRKRWPAVT